MATSYETWFYRDRTMALPPCAEPGAPATALVPEGGDPSGEVPFGLEDEAADAARTAE
jgi:hypothetical protein